MFQKMKKMISVEENGIYMVFGIDNEDCIKLFHFSALPFHEEDIVKEAVHDGFPFVDIELEGFNRPYERHGNKYIVTAPGYRMKYVGMTDERNDRGRLLEITTKDELTDVYVISKLQFYDGLPIVRFTHRVDNRGKNEQTLTYIGSFHYEGIEKEGKLLRDEKLKVRIPHHGWQRELNWKEYSFAELGMEQVQPTAIQRSSNFLHVSNTGNWSAKEYLPMGYLENTETKSALFWQIENNGSWHWEIGDQNGHFYLAVSGPDELYSHWFKQLKPGDSFETVPAAVGVSAVGFDDAMGTLTSYRRIIRRPNKDNENLPVIFNDYMNCLWGDPTAAEEFPLVDAAQAAGCEYFVIDAGWYADGNWWDNVGEWKESRLRFPNGVKEVTDYIRAHGMIPGVWVEPEVMGINCRMASKVPDEWFFVRHGKRVFDRSRYQLDYRNPEVRAYMDSVVDRLVCEYGVGYFKFDYNIEPGIGTELSADSVGDGLLQHERAYLSWLEGLWKRYPDLVIENCSSGGLRMDYAMLSRCSIQSTSDQDDYLKYAVIAANSPTGVTPEQSAVWAYPMNHEGEMREGTSAAHLEAAVDPVTLREETVFNMVNAMLLRIHQSGHLAKLDEGRRNLVKEALAAYKTIRGDIKRALPFWPLGLASYPDVWVCLGLKTEQTAYLAVWKRIPGDISCDIPLASCMPKGGNSGISFVYPKESSIDVHFEEKSGILHCTSQNPISACLIRVELDLSGDS